LPESQGVGGAIKMTSTFYCEIPTTLVMETLKSGPIHVGETASILSLFIKYPDFAVAVLLLLIGLLVSLKRIFGPIHLLPYFLVVTTLPRPLFTQSVAEVTRLEVYLQIFLIWALYCMMMVLLFILPILASKEEVKIGEHLDQDKRTA